MLKAIEEISSTKKRLKFEIPAEVVEREIQKVLKEIQKKANIPGFRPGKVPLSIIEKKFVEDVKSEVLERLLSESYREAVQQANLKPVLPPQSEDMIEIKRNEPLSFDLIVEIRPEVENLNYENIEIEELSIDITDEEVDRLIDQLSEEKGSYEPTEEAVKEGDLVVFDYKTDMGENIKDYVYKIGAGPYPEDFSRAFMGRKKGESFSFDIEFPQDSIATYAGKKINFQISLKEVKRKSKIPLEELPAELGFEDFESLKKYIRESLENSKKQYAEERKRAELLNKLIETHNFELPEGLLEMEIRRITEEYESRGIDITKNMDKILDRAKRNIKAFILLEIIGEKENITVTQEDLTKEVLELAKKYSMTPQAVIQYFMSKDGSLEGLRSNVFQKKVIDTILQKAKVLKKEEAK
ncbi:MAG: trigger factor [Thermodesulfovibrio sp.]|nr:trigger factor [Thermodesulfovibrio sp.]